MIYAENYRDILKDLISQKPRGEISKIANHLDIAATLISQVLAGKRHLTFGQAMAISNYFELVDHDKDYFLGTVHKGRSQEDDLINYWDLKLSEIKNQANSLKAKVKATLELDEDAKLKFYSSYLYSAIRLFCSIGNGKNITDICERFKISRSKATGIVDFLAAYGLIEKSDNLYVMTVQSTHVPKDSGFASQHHMNWRLKGLSHLNEIKDEDLTYTCVYSLDKKTMEEVKQQLTRVIEEAAKKAKAAPAEELVCLTLDLFKVES